ncbi:MAG TPA: chorismate lyase [Cellvibrio sp.]|nr:chorismate lyase [Cellvibrio sp.]
MSAFSDFSLECYTLPIFLPCQRELRWFDTATQIDKSWSGARLPLNLAPNSHLRPWLLDKSSLTAKLITLSRGNFRVQVLRQTYARPSRSEAKALGVAPHHLSLIREVILEGNNQPWVFARSVLPLTSLQGRLRHLRKQGTRPLGAFLFSQPQLSRSPIALALISRHHNYVPEILLGDTPVWGRRSIFYLYGKPLLVSEVFLSDFPGSSDKAK